MIRCGRTMDSYHFFDDVDDDDVGGGGDDGVRLVRCFHQYHRYSHFQMKMYAIQSFSSFLFPCGWE